MSNPADPRSVTFTNMGTHEGETTWYIEIDGEDAGEMTRFTATRYHRNGCSGIVQDRKAPKTWTFTDSEGCTRTDLIGDGTPARVAKRLVRDHLLAEG